MSSILEKISLSIPTKNRSDFLGRLLRSLAAQKFSGQVLIGDSSNDFHFETTQRNILSLNGFLHVCHERCSQMSDMQAVEHLCQYIQTPYSSIVCDDDLVCVKGIADCIHFLDQNPDYGAAHGLGFVVSLDRSGPYGNIIDMRTWPLATLIAGKGEERFKECFQQLGNVLFCVHRTKNWIDMYTGFHQMIGARQGFIFGELIPSLISAVRHKIKNIDCIYYIRQSHDALYSQTPFLQWMTDPEWLPAYQTFREKIIQELMLQDHLPFPEAEKIFYDGFHQYLYRFYQSEQSKQSANGYWAFKIKTLLKNIIRNVPGTAHLNKKRKVRHLRAQMNSSNHFDYPYLQDLKPIFDSIRVSR